VRAGGASDTASARPVITIHGAVRSVLVDRSFVRRRFDRDDSSSMSAFVDEPQVDRDANDC
jgi:hypothetical protein